MTTPPRVLIVDDDPLNRDILQTLLATQGFVILTAVDGEEGLAVAREQQPDLILLDVMMPKIDGIEVCRRLRKSAPLIGIVMLSVKSNEEDKIEAFDAGADDYITKPFHVGELAARLRVSIHVVYYWIERRIVEARKLDDRRGWWIALDITKEQELRDRVRTSGHLKPQHSNI